MQYIGCFLFLWGQQEISLLLINVVSGILVEFYYLVFGESVILVFIEVELKKIVQIVDGYEVVEDIYIVEQCVVWVKKNPRCCVDFFCVVVVKMLVSGIRC